MHKKSWERPELVILEIDETQNATGTGGDAGDEAS